MATLDDYDRFDVADLAIAPRTVLSGGHTVSEPERKLLVAVLTDAIVRYRLRGMLTDGARRSQLGEAARWILSDDRRWPYSFVNVCDALGLDPSAVRRAVIGGCSTLATRLRTTSMRSPVRRRSAAG